MFHRKEQFADALVSTKAEQVNLRPQNKVDSGHQDSDSSRPGGDFCPSRDGRERHGRVAREGAVREVAEAPWSVAEWAVALRLDNPRATVLL